MYPNGIFLIHVLNSYFCFLFQFLVLYPKKLEIIYALYIILLLLLKYITYFKELLFLICIKTFHFLSFTFNYSAPVNEWGPVQGAHLTKLMWISIYWMDPHLIPNLLSKPKYCCMTKHEYILSSYETR